MSSKIFNDSIHERIEIQDYCIKLIDTVEFQRLRNLKQLGFTNYVFTGANNTRFEHCIGVCWLSGEWAKHLQRRHPELNITSKDIKIVQMAGLLHDIGHGPYSHTFEKFINNREHGDIKYKHEDMTINIIKRMDIEKEEKDTIIDIIKGTLKIKPYLGHIVNNYINGIDADKLDYFNRDSQYTSFKIGCYWKRIVYESSVYNDEIVFPYKLIGDIFNLYQTRFRLYKELYFHKTVCKIENILLDAMILADKYNVFNPKLIDCVNNIDDFLMLNDDILGQMERCKYSDVTDKIKIIKTRKFKDESFMINNNVHSIERIAHYGTGNINPLTLVKFIDKNNNIKEIDKNTLDTLCPLKYEMSI